MKIGGWSFVLYLALATYTSMDMLQAMHGFAGSFNPSAFSATVDAIAADALSHSAPSLSVAVAREDEIIFAKAYGFADLERRLPATVNTPYQIGSVTKQFTAAAIMKLAEAGKLSPADSLSKHLPEFPAQEPDVTVHHLLNHTSGIATYTDFVTDATADISPQHVLDLVKDKPLAFEPGERFAYSNTGYSLLGLLIERLSGQSYGEYLQQQFFAPLNMTATSYCGAAPNADLPRGYMRIDERVVQAPQASMSAAYAAGALCSTAADLAKWTWSLARGGALSETSYAQMITPAALTSGGMSSYGYGLVADSRRGKPYIWHNGQISGFQSQLAFYPDDKLTVAVLANGVALNGLEAIERAIARAALGIHVADQPISAAERARCAGTYDLGPFKLHILDEDGVLKAQPSGQPASRLMHQGDYTFRLELDPDIRLVFEVQHNSITTLTLHQGHHILSAQRTP